MEQSQKTSTRKKFLLWSATVLSSLTVLNLISGSKQKKTETVKMLTQDGKLVEVDAEKLFEGKRKKISDEQLKNWVNKK
jgi:hemerythrin superfamily protein